MRLSPDPKHKSQSSLQRLQIISRPKNPNNSNPQSLKVISRPNPPTIPIHKTYRSSPDPKPQQVQSTKPTGHLSPDPVQSTKPTGHLQTQNPNKSNPQSLHRSSISRPSPIHKAYTGHPSPDPNKSNSIHKAYRSSPDQKTQQVQSSPQSLQVVHLQTQNPNPILKACRSSISSPKKQHGQSSPQNPTTSHFQRQLGLDDYIPPQKSTAVIFLSPTAVTDTCKGPLNRGRDSQNCPSRDRSAANGY